MLPKAEDLRDGVECRGHEQGVHGSCSPCHWKALAAKISFYAHPARTFLCY